MQEQLIWLIQDRVLYANRSGKESIAAIEAFVENAIKLLEAQDKLVHLIWHMQDLDTDGIDRREVAPYLNRIMRHPKIKWFVMVDSHLAGWQAFIAAIIVRFMGIHLKTVSSKNEGLNFLRKVDASL